jgi:hypothetical protein
MPCVALAASTAGLSPKKTKVLVCRILRYGAASVGGRGNGGGGLTKFGVGSSPAPLCFPATHPPLTLVAGVQAHPGKGNGAATSFGAFTPMSAAAVPSPGFAGASPASHLRTPMPGAMEPLALQSARKRSPAGNDSAERPVGRPGGHHPTANQKAALHATHRASGEAKIYT